MKALKIISLFAALAYISGCAHIIGISTSALENEKVRHAQVFDKDLSYCYDKTLGAFGKWKANSYQMRKGQYIIADRFDNVFNSCVDTTEVGIFFKKIEPNKTQVDVSSLNYHLSQFVADNLFKYIENPEAPTCHILTKEERTPALQRKK